MKDTLWPGEEAALLTTLPAPRYAVGDTVAVQVRSAPFLAGALGMVDLVALTPTEGWHYHCAAKHGAAWIAESDLAPAVRPVPPRQLTLFGSEA